MIDYIIMYTSIIWLPVLFICFVKLVLFICYPCALLIDKILKYLKIWR